MARTDDIQNDPAFRLLRRRQNALLAGLRRHRLCIDKKPSGRVRGAVLGSPRSGLTQVSTPAGQDQ